MTDDGRRLLMAHGLDQEREMHEIGAKTWPGVCLSACLPWTLGER